jgi:hypothetical protein
MKPAEPIDIRAHQASKPKKQKIEIEINLSVDEKYVQMIFPGRLGPMEGLLLTAKKARHIANLLTNKASKVKGIVKPGLSSIVLSVIILILIFIVGFQHGRIKDAEQRAFKAETRIVQLKQAVKWVSVLEQILPEGAKTDLDLLSGQLGEGG